MEKNKLNVIYVLHEFGSPSHYSGLKEYLKDKSSDIRFYEFTFIRQFCSGIRHFKLNRIIRSFENFLFMVNLLLTKDKKIIVGIAPLDYRMLLVLKFINNHKYYYHTSWPFWVKSKLAKENIISKVIYNSWISFFSNCSHVFSVTETAKNSLVKYKWFNIDNISIVYHSFDSSTFNYNNEKKNMTISFIGRLEEDKGILDIIELAKRLPDYKFVIIGTGSYEDTLKNLNIENITVLGFISDRNKISNYLQISNYLLLPSKRRVDGWEELFGMAIIEAMACGCIPISTNHVGPQEILRSCNELITEENKYVEHALSIIREKDSQVYKKKVINLASVYSISEIKKRWSKIDE